MGDSNRCVIVTGGTGGVGLPVSRRWLDIGASLLLVGSSQESVDRAVQGLDGGSRVHGVACDLTTPVGADRMAQAAQESFGRQADTLIHLVGGFAMNRIEAGDAVSNWDRMIAMNLTSAFHCYRAAIAGFRTHGRGWIVGMTSRAAIQPGPQVASYAAAKAGLVALTRSLAAETRAEPINVNVIATSTVDTAANRASMGEKKSKDWVTPDDIADATLYLCSESSKSVSGAVLEVYGRA